MSFKPSNASRTSSVNFEPGNFPTPRAGSRKARVSLIVDMGVQNREPFEDPNTKEMKELKPCQQVAVFADLVADTVDYGGSIGKQHYRMLLNKSFQGNIQGVNFVATPPKDAKGNLVPGKPWGFHPANLLTKIARAVGRPEVVESMDVEELMGLPFMAQVEVKETEDKNGKTGKEGNILVYKNVNFKGAAEVPEDDDGNPLPVADLNNPALCITFDNARKEDIKWIRAGLLKQIKLANNYAGSQMRKAIEAFEAENAQGDDDDSEDAPAAKPAVKAAQVALAKKAAAKPKPVVQDHDEGEDSPF